MLAEPSSSQPEGRVARDAYQRALKTYKESLSAKEYAKIKIPASLDDVIETTEVIRAKHQTSKTIRLCDTLKSTKDRLERFGTLLESALKGVMGGELLWASINFVFVVASDSAETFAKLLEALVTTSEKMPQFEILANMFGESKQVIDSVEALYVAIIKFWVGAAKFYRRKRLWRLPLWNDYSIYFQDLVSELDKQERRLRDTAEIQHMQEVKEERIENREFRRQTTFGRMTASKIMMKWLSPADIYEPDFFRADFEKANRKRHHGTCEWIKRKTLYRTWETAPSGSGVFLVIYGIPGAGKTVLSSYLVSNCVHQIPSGSARIGLYFFFDNKDEYKRSPLSVARSLVYQLYAVLKERGQEKSIRQELELRMQNSAMERAMDYERLWAIFRTVISAQNLEVVVVLDAMDECNGSKPLIRDLKKLAATASVRVIITSRSDNYVVPVFSEGQGVPSLYITTEDLKQDIVSYVQAKVKKSASLQHPQVKDRVVTNLVTKSGGMFLWVYLMLKVLKSLPTVSDILNSLSTLPEKLDDVYKRILLQLQDSLKPRPRVFCQLVLRWIVATSRPLRFAELVEGLKAEYNKTSAMFDQESGFQDTLLYGRKDIELVCGSLVTVSEDSIRLIHLSTRDYLRSSPEVIGLTEPLSRFLVDVPLVQNRIALTCLEYLSSHNVLESPNLQPSIDRSTATRQQELEIISARNPLFKYAVLYWPNYIVSNIYWGTAEAMGFVDIFLRGKAAITWLEVYIFFSGPEFAASTARQLSKAIGALPGTTKWADALIEILDEYSTTMTKAPQMVHFCFRSEAMSETNAVQSVAIAPLESNGKDDDRKRSLTDVEKGAKSWVHYDKYWKTIFMTSLTHPSMRLACQSLQDGIRYRPVIDAEEESPSGEWAVRSFAVRPGGSHIAVTFCPTGTKGVAAESLFRTVVWLIKDPSKQLGMDDWAERVLVKTAKNPVFRNAVAYSYITEGRGNVVSFSNNGTLFTPGGIYNIFTDEKQKSPAEIFQPAARIAGTSFNANRVARVRDLTELEILSLDGSLIDTFSFPGSEVLQICSMGYSGQKIIVTYSDVTARKGLRRIQCVHVSTRQTVRLQSRGVSRMNFARFTASEKYAVGRVSCNPDHSGSEISVWNLDDGQMTHLLKDPDPQLSFCFGSNEDQIIITSSSGRLMERNIHDEWSDAEEAMFSRLHISDSGTGGSKILWRLIGDSEIWRLSSSPIPTAESTEQDGRVKKSAIRHLSSMLGSIGDRVAHVASKTQENNKVLEKRVWNFKANSTKDESIPFNSNDTSSTSISTDGSMITIEGDLICVSIKGLQQVPQQKRSKHTTQVYLSPDGRYMVRVEEKNSSRTVRTFRFNNESLGLTALEPRKIDGYVMDFSIVFHEYAPIFAMSYTAMDSVYGGMTGTSEIGIIRDEAVHFHNITGTFHPSFGFSHCGDNFFGTIAMNEQQDDDIYTEEPENEEFENDEETNGETLDASENAHVPNFDEPTFDEAAPGPLTTELSSPSNGGADPGVADARSQEQDSERPFSRESSLSENSGAASDVIMERYRWPKLYPLPLELRHPVPQNQLNTVRLKLGAFWVRDPIICRLRLSENMGILYLDKLELAAKRIQLANKKNHSSRVVCVIPDVFLDLSTTEIVMIWPQGSNTMSITGKSPEAVNDCRVRVVLFPAGQSNVPVLISTGLHGPNLLDF
ncbi:MAG: hypothetical protein Q9219_002432 [cf. Caloplaca sp. 3 TL-2023]